MSGAPLAFLIVGALALVAGLAMLALAVRGRPGENPRSTALLIAGMMASAFGLLLAAFALGAAEPAR